MEKELIATGGTYEEALEKACQQLGVERSDVEYEVLERPKTSLFGLKKTPAKIRVILTDEYLFKFAPKEERRKPEQKPPQRQEKPQEAPRQQGKESRPEQKPAQQTAPQQGRESRPEQKPAQQAAPQQGREPRPEQRPAQQAAAQQSAPQQRPERPQAAAAEAGAPDRRKQERPERPQGQQGGGRNNPPRKAAPGQEAGFVPDFDPETMAAREEPKELSPEVLEQKGSASAAYLKEVLGALGYPDTEITYSQKDGTIVLQLLGESLGSVVGRRGDNLDAMQYLASLVANRSEGAYVRVVLDVDDYRSKREASLQAYARKTASQAVRGGRAITLEAMNPYERRIVHSAVQAVEGATSKSVGSEPNRRVVISPVEGARPQLDRGGEHRGPRPGGDRAGDRGGDRGGDRRGGRGGRRDGGRDGRERRESQKVIVPPSDEPKKDDTSAISLYGRIDLG
ncbi:MAG TPA: RNA-binding cell elongation regulator Jag/EloR [Oscillospiraceae bacterium]|nr:RNA-binding cell elongation regulator Jag/EloR [Oscillospiraceae bacterium]HPW00373.1 RNA-binding cell elongation regulator Jag/EloR [Oscillospiraceae bacterium]